jgi:hypothetical protein
MVTYIASIISQIQHFSKNLDDIALLTNQHWVSLGEIDQAKKVYIFDKNGSLDIYENGYEVDSGTWKFGNQSLKLKLKNEGYLLKHGFFDENVIALKLDSTDGYTFFINETKYNGELNNIGDIIQFLDDKYLSKGSKGSPNIRFGKKDKLGNIIIPNYSAGQYVEHSQWFESDFYTSVISFEDNVIGTLFKRKSDNKYYFHHNGIKYGDYLDVSDCIKNLYIVKTTT